MTDFDWDGDWSGTESGSERSSLEAESRRELYRQVQLELQNLFGHEMSQAKPPSCALAKGASVVDSG